MPGTSGNLGIHRGNTTVPHKKRKTSSRFSACFSVLLGVMMWAAAHQAAHAGAQEGTTARRPIGSVTAKILGRRFVGAGDVQRLALPVENLVKGTNFTVSRQVGTNVVAVTGAITIVDGKLHVVPPTTNEWIYLQDRGATRSPLVDGNVMVSPDVAVALLDSGELVSAQLSLVMDNNPVPWDERSLRYRTTVRIGYDTTASTSAKLPKVVAHLEAAELNLEEESQHVLTIPGPGFDNAVPVPIFTKRTSGSASLTLRSSLGEGEKWPIEIQKLGIWGMITQIAPGPTLFLICFGGALGGLVRCLKSGGSKRKMLPWFIIEGLATGLVLVAIVVGLGWSLPFGQTPIQVLTSPMSLFALAVFGGYGGAMLIDRMFHRYKQQLAGTK